MTFMHQTVWREGMFLQPQHFQQNNRYLDDKISKLISLILPFYFGFEELKINQHFLEQGKIVIDSAHAIFQDASIYNAPDHDSLPEALQVPVGSRDVTVYLGLYDRRLMIGDHASNQMNRFQTIMIDCPDTLSEDGSRSKIEVSNLKPQLLTDQYELSNYCLLPIAKIKEVRPDNKIYLDTVFIEPRISIHKHPLLFKSLEEIFGLLLYRSEILSKRLNQGDQSESVMVSDFMMLELMNRFLVKIRNMLAMPRILSVDAYDLLVELLAQLSTYTHQNRVLENCYLYDHNHTHQTFIPLLDQLRHSLSLVLEQHAKSITLIDHSNGLFAAENIKESLFSESQIILGIYANAPQDDLRSSLPNQIKIAPLSEIKDMVSRGVSGLSVRTLPTAPRQIPYHANYIYFEIDQNNLYWDAILQSNSLCIHMSAQYQDLRMELWSIHS